MCRLGALAVDGAARAVDAIGAERRTLQAIDQRAAQGAMIAKLGLAATVPDFIAANVADTTLRLDHEARASRDALAFDWPAMRRVDVG